MKIRSIKLKNFRGARREVTLAASSNESILLYGDNGTGKSSFLDAAEWFITDKVTHLSGEEIEKHGGLRHALSSDDEDTLVEFKFSSNLENSKKLLEVKKNRLKTSFSKENEMFTSTINEISNERLWIRNSELVDFIIKSKSERLVDISDIIGYDKVSKTKGVLKKSVNELKKVLRIRNFEGISAGKKAKIAEELGQMVNTSEQFYSAINELLKKKKINLEINDKNSLKKAINVLKARTNGEELVVRQTLEGIKKNITDFEDSVNSNIQNFDDYQKEALEIQDDSEGLKNISLVKLYNEAKKIIAHNKEDGCPLCLSEVKKEDLLKIISNKLEALKQFNEKISNFNTIKKSVLEIFLKLSRDIDSIKGSLLEIKKDFSIDQEALDNISGKSIDLKKIVKEIEKEDIVNVDLSKTSISKDSLIATFISIRERIEESINSKKTENNSEIIDLITSITTGRAIF